jgi:hypothetical protein
MLTAAFALLTVAVLMGALLAVAYLREGAAPPPLPLGVLHGLIGIGGLALLTLALRGPPRGADQGTGSFGIIAAVLVATAAAVGLAQLALRLRGRRLSGTLIGVHATLAVGSFVILLVYVLG